MLILEKMNWTTKMRTILRREEGTRIRRGPLQLLLKTSKKRMTTRIFITM